MRIDIDRYLFTKPNVMKGLIWAIINMSEYFSTGLGSIKNST